MTARVLKSGAEQVADMIETYLKNGSWSEKLPGIKSLARELEINHKTVARALSILENRGLLEPPRGRRARRVLGGLSTPLKRTKLRLLIVHPYINTAESTDMGMIHSFQQVWLQSQGKVLVKAVDASHRKKVRLYLQQLIDLHAADALLMINLPLAWAKAGLDKLPCYFSGGSTPQGRKISIFGYERKMTFQHILATLGELGHQKVLWPIRLLGSGVREDLLSASSGLNHSDTFPKISEENCPYVYYEDPATWLQMWERAFNKKICPTAVVVTEMKHLLSFYGFCYRQQIRVPEDVSVVLVGSNKNANWLTPQPSVCQFSTEMAVEHFKTWIRNDLKPIGKKTMTLKLAGNESLARATSKELFSSTRSSKK